jgi:hypothetical protein
MLDLLLYALQTADSGPAGADPVEKPREISWQELCLEQFTLGSALPMPSEAEADGQPRDLTAWFADWLARDLALAPGAEAEEGHVPVRVGDLVAELKPLRGDTLRLERALLLKTAQLPGLDPAGRERLRELLCDSALQAEDWDPEDDFRDDGLLHLPSWEMDEDTAGVKRWQERSGDGTVLRTAVLLHCGLEDWFAIENDPKAYFRFATNRFEEVEIVAGSETRTEQPDGSPVEGRWFRVVSDLPFPFGDYEALTRVRTVYRQDGTVVADVYSDSDDFHWFAGRDVFLPVRKADGERIAWLCLQEFGFDLDNVPEREKDRRAGVRMTLGNKKRMAEALQANSLEE